MADAAIPLSFQFPKIPDATQSLMQGMSLRQMAAQAQQAPEHLRALQMQNQQTQQSLDDQQTQRQAYMDSGGDMDRYQQLLMQRGANPATLYGVQQHLLQMREANAKLKGEDLDNSRKQASGVSDAYQGLLNMPDEDTRRQAWPAVRQGLITSKYATEGQLNPIYQGIDDATLHRNAGVTAVGQIDIADKRTKEQRDTDNHNNAMAKAKTDQAEADLKVKQGQLAQDASQLSTSPTYADYTKARAASANKARFPDYSAMNPADTLRPEHVKAVRQIGLTDEQAVVTGDTESRNAQTKAFETQAHLDRMAAAGAKVTAAANTPAANRAAHETDMKAMDNKVLTDTLAMGGKTAADVVGYLKDPARWKDDPDIPDNRAELIDRWTKRGEADLKDANTAARTAAVQQKGKPTDFMQGLNDKRDYVKAHPGQATMPSDDEVRTWKAGTKASVTTPAQRTAPQSQAAPAQPAAAATTPADPRVTMKLPDGKFVSGPKSQIDKFMKEQGYTLQQ